MSQARRPKRKELGRRIIGLYVYPDGTPPNTHCYAQVIFEITCREGNSVFTSKECGPPIYEHDYEVAGEQWPVVFPLFKHIYKASLPVIEAATKRKKARKR